MTMHCPKCNKKFISESNSLRELMFECPECKTPLEVVQRVDVRKWVRRFVGWAVFLGVCATAFWVAKTYYPHETIERAAKLTASVGLPAVNVSRILALGGAPRMDISPLYGVDLGNAAAVMDAALTYRNNDNMPLALRYLTMAATQGHAEAQYTLGQLYFLGTDVAKDTQLAMEWLKKAAQQKNIDALRALGRYYRVGEGVDADLALAKKYYSEAAALGDAYAKNQLAEMAALERVQEREKARDERVQEEKAKEEKAREERRGQQGTNANQKPSDSGLQRANQRPSDSGLQRAQPIRSRRLGE